MYLLSEGNLEKLEKVEELLNPYVDPVVKNPFSGNLKPFNELRATLRNNLKLKIIDTSHFAAKKEISSF